MHGLWKEKEDADRIKARALDEFKSLNPNWHKWDDNDAATYVRPSRFAILLGLNAYDLMKEKQLEVQEARKTSKRTMTM